MNDIMMENSLISSCIKSASFWMNFALQVELEEQEKLVKQQIHSIRITKQRIRFRDLTERHFMAMKVADESFELLQRSADSLMGMDSVIKTVKEARNKFRKEGNSYRSNECTELISRLANTYYGIRNERNNLLETQRKLNRKTELLRNKIASTCGKRGKAWANDRLEKRTA